MTDEITQPLAKAVADERLRIIAGLIRLTGDWELAEDCFSDAVERALAHWPRGGVPDNPSAWLTTTARRRAVDVLRRRRTEADKLREIASWAEPGALSDDDSERDPYGRIYRDDRVRLLFTCCHPALPLTGRVALTLHTVAGLTTREIARAFLVSEATMGQRLLRTRNKITHSGIRLGVPEPDRLAARTAGVLAVVYLIFNEGYGGSEGEGIRDDLAAEALRLSALVAELLPDDDEVHGLRALLLLQHARRAARTDLSGELVTMAEQDRTRWDRTMIAAGLASLSRARSSGRPAGPYRLQAQIAAEHSIAADADSTDWARVVAGYDLLLAAQPSPVVALNRAVALGFRDGPEVGLRVLDEVERAGGLAGYRLVPTVRADLLRRAGRSVEAVVAYQEALDSPLPDAERRFLTRRLRDLALSRPLNSIKQT